VDLDAWKYFRTVIERLSIDGMSSEEDDARDLGGRVANVFLVKFCAWRAEEIAEYLKFVDKEAENPVLCGTRGSKACPRLPSEIPGTTIPLGLPRKMYNPHWLKEQPLPVLDTLRVSEEAFEMLKLAAHY
jgi:hypothetical protein